jgi:uncharacterized membrane protein
MLVLTAYTALLLAVGPITLQQYDLFPATFALLAVVAYADARDGWAWAFLALGTMAKVYPILLAPVFLMLDERATLRGRTMRAAIAFGATCVIVLLPLLLVAPTSVARMVAYHTGRGIQVESLYSSLALVANSLGWGDIGSVFSFGSYNVTGHVVDLLAKLSTPLLLVALLVAYAVVFRRSSQLLTDHRRDVNILATSSALVLLAGLVTSKVLSPQYLIWLLPLLPLTVRPGRRLVWGVFAAAGVATYYIYPLHYDDLIGRVPSAIAVLAARNLLLLILLVIVARSLRIACTAGAAAHERSPQGAGAA